MIFIASGELRAIAYYRRPGTAGGDSKKDLAWPRAEGRSGATSRAATIWRAEEPGRYG